MTTLTRADIQRFTNDSKVIRGLETAFNNIAQNGEAIAANVEATQGIQNATVVLLSVNDQFSKARVLETVAPLALNDTGAGANIIIGLSFPLNVSDSLTVTGGPLTLTLTGSTNVTLPTMGTLVTEPFPGPYANDAAAATANVPIGHIYRVTGGAVAWRQV